MSLRSSVNNPSTSAVTECNLHILVCSVWRSSSIICSFRVFGAFFNAQFSKGSYVSTQLARPTCNNQDYNENYAARTENIIREGQNRNLQISKILRAD